MALTLKQQDDLWSKAHSAATALADVARALEDGARRDDLAAEADKLSNDMIVFAAKINPSRLKLYE